MLTLALIVLFTVCGLTRSAQAGDRPNIVFAFADDWGYPHAGVYGDDIVKTPAFDRVAREGVLFANAFVDVPSCTPSRGAVLSGQQFYRLRQAANLWSTMPSDIPLYTDLLSDAGYHVGFSRKGWSPGKLEPGGRKINPAGKPYRTFEQFLNKRTKGQPFCYWWGSHEPHRPYKPGSGRAAGIDVDRIKPYPCMPNVPAVREDIADYYGEVQQFDDQVAALIAQLEKIGELDNTIIVVSGDHGMPFPRCKSNLYDTGMHVPLAIRWGAKIKPGRQVTDFVNLADLAPTFLDAAGVKIPQVMTARSLMPVLTAPGNGRIDAARDHVIFGRERHCVAQEAPQTGGYPARAVRNDDYLYIRNFDPDRWPAGTPHYDKAQRGTAWFGDCDNGPSKFYMWAHRNDPDVKPLYDLCFAQRPAEELYDLKKDPDQHHNVAADPAYAAVRKQLADQLMTYLRQTDDPRVVGGGEKLDKYPYYGGTPSWPGDQAFEKY
ncbi:sulfatase [Planctomycetales bacterium ZRK34]|nr:sulfatase [Planctomycetales bacterium ZRK34]